MECSADTCVQPATHDSDYGRVCQHHFMAWRRYGYLGSRYPPTCTVDGCERKHLGIGLCSMHYRRLRERGTTDDLPRKNARPICSVEACHLKAESLGLCSKHYTRMRRYGTVELPPPPVPDPVLCAQCGGPRPPRRKTYCSEECAKRGDFHVRLATSRANQLRRYGLTIDSYEALLQAQGRACAICGDTNPKNYRGRNESFCVDHDHVTGKVRGLLCNLCNNGIGALGDDPERVRAALAYLELHMT